MRPLATGILWGRALMHQLRTAAAIAMLALPSACATIHRAPFTSAQQEAAVIAGIPEARFWGDAADAGQRMAPRVPTGTPLTMLALSGGSDNGAYGAGLLNGWTRSGQRPEFTIVTGVSTGALIAPFAFLGPRYDATIGDLYTHISARGIYRLRFPLAILGSTSAASSKPLAQLIDRTVSRSFVDAVAVEHRRGRRLFIGTANLDAQRTTIWDMGAIAASDAPGRYALFRQVMLASSSIPAFFPPVVIDAVSGNRTIRELHVDGGTTAQILTVPTALLRGEAAPSSEAGRLRLYMIVNGRLTNSFKLVHPKVLPILTQAFSLNLQRSLYTLVSASYVYADAHAIDFNLSYIGSDFPSSDAKPFDTAYMRRLYDYGIRQGEGGAFWNKRPPAAGQ